MPTPGLRHGQAQELEQCRRVLISGCVEVDGDIEPADVVIGKPGSEIGIGIRGRLLHPSAAEPLVCRAGFWPWPHHVTGRSGDQGVAISGSDGAAGRDLHRIDTPCDIVNEMV
jgi:hypothetical protein